MERLPKVPEVTLLFWITKIIATTLGETGGDSLSMSLNLGYLVSSGIFAILFALCLALQMRAKSFSPTVYWLAIVSTTTLGTTLADFADRTLGIGYLGGSSLLLGLLLSSLWIWKLDTGTISIRDISTPKSEAHYWITIMFSQTLGTALGDWCADTESLGYLGSAVIFGAGLAVLAILHFRTRIPKTILFWAAFVLTRPLGAVLGDFLDKPLDKGGLNLNRFSASAVLLAAMAVCVYAFKQRPAARQH